VTKTCLKPTTVKKSYTSTSVFKNKRQSCYSYEDSYLKGMESQERSKSSESGTDKRVPTVDVSVDEDEDDNCPDNSEEKSLSNVCDNTDDS
jgi:hypothetical protein